jgi:hypothetical protein
MADYIIEIPGNKDQPMKIGDTLRINFKTPAKFCINPGDPADAFNPPLPVGCAEDAGWWPGPDVKEAAKAVKDATITYCHVGHDKPCEPCKKTPPLTGPGTIKIGSGRK